jgi:beta-galactosidase GanA
LSILGASNEETRECVFLSWGGVGSKARAESAAEIGINMHRLPMWWGTCEKREGEFDFDGIDEVAGWILDAGMDLIVNFSNHGVPKWFFEKYPQARIRDALGRTDEVEGGPSYWFSRTRYCARRFMNEAIAYLIQKGIWDEIAGVEVCVQFEGQLSYPLSSQTWAFDRYALEAYSNYLKVKYANDIGRLNDDWGSKYKDFSSVLPPATYGEDKEHEVFLGFYRQNLLDAAVQLTDAVDKRLPAGKKWLYMSHQGPPGPMEYATARYPVYYMKRLKELNRVTHVILAVIESWQPDIVIPQVKDLGIKVIGEIWINPTAMQQRQQSDLAKRYDCDGFFVGVLENLFECDGTPTAVGEETARVIQEWLTE